MPRYANLYRSTLQSIIIGKTKRLRENAPTGRGKVARKSRVPISNTCAPLSTGLWLISLMNNEYVLYHKNLPHLQFMTSKGSVMCPLMPKCGVSK